MQKGNFFESLVIGCTSDGTVVTELPALKKGGKSVDQIRIEEQAAECKRLLNDEFKIRILGKQTVFQVQVNEHFFVKTAVDIYGTGHSDLINSDHVVIDLKLTESVENKFGDFAWGSPEFLDHTQAFLIDYLYNAKFKHKPDFYYFVFDYSPSKGFKFLKKRITEVDQFEMINRIEYAMGRIAMFEADGYVTVANAKNCKNCPISSTCPDYRVIQIEVI
jgi:hypothetical protein